MPKAGCLICEMGKYRDLNFSFAWVPDVRSGDTPWLGWRDFFFFFSFLSSSGYVYVPQGLYLAKYAIDGAAGLRLILST